MDNMQNPNGYEQVGGQPPLYVPPREEKKKGFAITALVLAIVSVLGYCCGIFVITAPLSIIFAIIALVKKQALTALSITSIILSVLCIAIPAIMLFSFREILPYSEEIVQDYVQLIQEQDEVFPAYEKDHTLPSYLSKYQESPFTEFFEKYDFTIYDVMDVLLEEYKSGQLAEINISLPADFSSAVASA